MKNLGKLLILLCVQQTFAASQLTTYHMYSTKHQIVHSKSSNILDLSSLLTNHLLLAVKDPTTGVVSYTHDGIFYKKGNYYYQNKWRLQGYSIPSPLTATDCKLTDVKIPSDTFPAKATTTLEVVKLNLSSMSMNPTSVFNPYDPSSYNYTTSSVIFDSLGQYHNLQLYYVKTEPDAWVVNVLVDGYSIGTGNLTFNPSGSLSSVVGLSSLSFKPEGAEPMNISINMTGATQFGSPFTSYPMIGDGYPTADAIEEVLDENGYLSEKYSNGVSNVFSKVAVFAF